MDAPLSISGLGRAPDAGLLRALPTGRADVMREQASFAAALGRAGRDSGMTDADRARDAAQDFVAQTFVQPLLKQFRDSDRTPAPFGPSQGEKQFRALMDVELARRIVRAQHFPLVDRLAQDLLRGSGSPAP